jgi:FixJ family two-component response regulator
VAGVAATMSGSSVALRPLDTVLKSIIRAAVKGEEVSCLMNKQIADELSIGEVTVKMHRSSTMRKLSAKSVARQDLQVQKIVNASSKEVEHEIKRL